MCPASATSKSSRLIQGAVEDRDDIDGRFMAAQIATHPLYARSEPSCSQRSAPSLPELYFDAGASPGVFAITGEESLADDDRAVRR